MRRADLAKPIWRGSERLARSFVRPRSGQRRGKVIARAGLISGLFCLWATFLSAQELTRDPGAWRPLAYANLQSPGKHNATWTDIWQDAIQANNDAYRSRGDHRFIAANAPATEAHFVIWSAKKSVVASVLNTALGCLEKSRAKTTRVKVKLCPMRLAIYDGLTVKTMDAGRACFLEPEPGATLDPSQAAAYGAYDIASKTLKLGMIVDHNAVEGCSFNIPLDGK